MLRHWTEADSGGNSVPEQGQHGIEMRHLEGYISLQMTGRGFVSLTLVKKDVPDSM